MNSRRANRNSRAALFDDIEEGVTRTSSYSSHEIQEYDNDKALDGLQDRVNILKRLTGDIHEEVQSHNRELDRMGNSMDASRGVLSGTVDRFKMVFAKKSSKRMATLVMTFLVSRMASTTLMRKGTMMLHRSDPTSSVTPNSVGCRQSGRRRGGVLDVESKGKRLGARRITT
ncbi:hypothetical protein Taro_035936, partial [Colocasia esculenta]|nr:hypothetical protein [Colocasia esculenta]